MQGGFERDADDRLIFPFPRRDLNDVWFLMIATLVDTYRPIGMRAIIFQIHGASGALDHIVSNLRLQGAKSTKDNSSRLLIAFAQALQQLHHLDALFGGGAVHRFLPFFAASASKARAFFAASVSHHMDGLGSFM